MAYQNRISGIIADVPYVHFKRNDGKIFNFKN